MAQSDAIPNLGGGFLALAQVANQHGVLAGAAHLARGVALGHKPPTAEDLARSARLVGLRARIIRDPSVRRLSRLPVPAIFKVKDGTWALLGVEVTPGRFRVSDPVTRRQELLTIEEVMARLDHDVIVIRKGAGLAVEQLKFGFGWFMPALRRYRLPFVHVLVASFFINLLQLATPLCFQLAVDKVLVSKSYSTLLVVILTLVVLSVFSALLQYLRTYTINHTSNRIDIELGSRLYGHLVRLPIAYFERRAAGIIVARVREIETIRRFMTDKGLPSVIDLLFIFLYIGVLYIYSPLLTLILVLIIPFYLLIGIAMRPTYRRTLKDKFRLWSKTQQLLVESVVGVQTIKASAVEPTFQRLWEERLAGYVKTSFDSVMLGTLAQSGVQLISKLQTAVILFFGTLQVIAGSMTVGELIAFSMISQRMNQPILRSAQLYQSFLNVQVSLEHMSDILDAPIEPHAQSTTVLPALRGAIELRAVSFRYRPELPDAVRGVDLVIEPGEVIGIVGPSGSGKSTLTKLIQRFHSPTQGRILLDGTDVADVDPAWLRRQLGVVLQENFLFNQTVHDNIALANPLASRAEVVRCARLAGADEFIAKLPQGYDSVIEERGANLSGGQRQRIAIARALATDPRILILDEATSALDYESERIIRGNMRRIAQGRTVIVIAHRLAAVRQCDRIVGMTAGEIVEIGSHDQLLRRRNGLYAHLWALQTDQVTA